MDYEVQKVEEYLNKLEASGKNDKLCSAISVLELLGFDVQYDLINNKYHLKGGCYNGKRSSDICINEV